MIMKNIFDGQCSSLDAGHHNNEKKLIKNDCFGTDHRTRIAVTDCVWNSWVFNVKKIYSQAAAHFLSEAAAQIFHGFCTNYTHC